MHTALVDALLGLTIEGVLQLQRRFVSEDPGVADQGSYDCPQNPVDFAQYIKLGHLVLVGDGAAKINAGIFHLNVKAFGQGVAARWMQSGFDGGELHLISRM